MAAFGLATTASVGGELVDISVELDGWTIFPIADAGATTHLVAVRNDDEARTTDIDIVLYERVGESWVGTAYDPQIVVEDAMVDLAIELGLPNPYDGTWRIELDPTLELGFVLPREQFDSGFVTTEPLYQVAVLLENPEVLVEGAEDAGLSAGGSAVNTGVVSGGVNIGGATPIDGCLRGTIQTAIAAGADAYLADPSVSILEIDDIIDEDLRTAGQCCIETTTCGPISLGPWICGGWVYVGFNQLIGECTYERNVFRQQTINCVKKCDDCVTQIPFTQNRIQSGEARATTFAFSNNAADCTPPPNSPCNATGAVNFTTTNWAPPPPQCP